MSRNSSEGANTGGGPFPHASPVENMTQAPGGPFQKLQHWDPHRRGNVSFAKSGQFPMKQRGRKSAAALEAPVFIDARDRPIEATERLTPEQADVFAEIVSNLSGRFFSQEQSPLVCQLARHVVSCRRLSRLLDRLERLDNDGIDLKDYAATLDARRKESAQIVSIARALRLTNQSRYRPGQAGREAENRPRPWEA